MFKNRGSHPEGDAANIIPPRQGNGQQISVTDTPVATALTGPGRWVRVTNIGANKVRVQIHTSSTVTLTFAGTNSAQMGFELAPGQSEQWVLESTDTHIHHACSTGLTSTLQVWIAGEAPTG